MLTILDAAPRRLRGQPRLVFAPLAWLKLQLFCHLGETEIAGFGITAKNNPLYVEEFVTVKQVATSMTVALDDDAIADFVDRSVDAGLTLQQVLRIWCHTHPGSSPDPSATDEETFARVFGSCDWAVMFILSRTSATYARLSFHVGPGSAVNLSVSVNWAAWPVALTRSNLTQLMAQWQDEFAANVTTPAIATHQPGKPDETSAKGSPWEPFAPSWDWTDLDQQLLEDYERNAELYGHDL